MDDKSGFPGRKLAFASLHLLNIFYDHNV